MFCRPGKLAAAGILPPGITRLSAALRAKLGAAWPEERDALSVAELGDMLLALKRPGAGQAERCQYKRENQL